MPIKIRKSLDLTTLLKLQLAIFPEDEIYFKDTMHFWIAYDGKVPIGFCIINQYDSSTCWFPRAGVLAGYRGKGLQRRLISVRTRWAKKNGFKSIFTYTLRGNIPSSRNLIKSGFNLYEPEEEYAGEVNYFMLEL